MFNIEFCAAAPGWLPGCDNRDNGKCLIPDSHLSPLTQKREKELQDKGCNDLTEMSAQAAWSRCPFSSPSAHAFRVLIKGSYLPYVHDGDSQHWMCAGWIPPTFTYVSNFTLKSNTTDDAIKCSIIFVKVHI